MSTKESEGFNGGKLGASVSNEWIGDVELSRKVDKFIGIKPGVLGVNRSLLSFQ